MRGLCKVSCWHRINWVGLLTKMLIILLKEVKSYTCVDELKSCIASSDKLFQKTMTLSVKSNFLTGQLNAIALH